MCPASWNTYTGSSIVICVVTIVFFNYNLKIVPGGRCLSDAKRASVWRRILRVRMRSRHKHCRARFNPAIEGGPHGYRLEL